MDDEQARKIARLKSQLVPFQPRPTVRQGVIWPFATDPVRSVVALRIRPTHGEAKTADGVWHEFPLGELN